MSGLKVKSGHRDTHLVRIPLEESTECSDVLHQQLRTNHQR